MVKGNVYAGTDSITLRKIVRHGRKNGVPARNICRAYGTLVERRTGRLERSRRSDARAAVKWERSAPARKSYCEDQRRLRDEQREARLRAGRVVDAAM